MGDLRLHALAVIVLCGCCCLAQLGGVPQEPKAAAVKADIPYIKCQVCEAFVKQAINVTKRLREAATASKKLDDGDILDALEALCKVDSDSGDWITHYDIVEDGSKLKLVDTEKVGKCKTECRTIARACEEVQDNIDLTELSEALYHGKKSRSQLSNWVCYELSNACSKKPPPLPAGRSPGPAHEALSAEEITQRNLMRQMSASGLGGRMFDSNSMSTQFGGRPGAADEDDDEDEAEEVLEGVRTPPSQPKLKSTGGVGATTKASALLQTAADRARDLFDSATAAATSKLKQGIGAAQRLWASVTASKDRRQTAGNAEL